MSAGQVSERREVWTSDCCVMVSPEAMSAAAHYIDREYGPHGYRMGLSGDVYVRRVYIFEVAHFDGSRFNIAVDDWGNVERIPDDASDEQAREQVYAMSGRACQS